MSTLILAKEAQENLDNAVCEYLEAQGVNIMDIDFSALDELLQEWTGKPNPLNDEGKY